MYVKDNCNRNSDNWPWRRSPTQLSECAPKYPDVFTRVHVLFRHEVAEIQRDVFVISSLRPTAIPISNGFGPGKSATKGICRPLVIANPAVSTNGE
jgi:hypothetical protein